MDVTREERVRMERAHVRAWPALHTAVIDGWLWRQSGGGSQRANSVSAIDFTGGDLDAAIDTVEERYRGVGVPAQFHTFEETNPAGLADALRRRGYSEGEATLTLFRRLAPAEMAPTQVEVRAAPWDGWLEVYIAAISESRRAVNREILASIPEPRGFFGGRQGDRVVSTAVGIAGFGCVVAECVATRAELRRQGGARAVMQSLLSWAAHQQADLIGLQVVASNLPAVRLYESLGFFAGATNRFWRAG